MLQGSTVVHGISRYPAHGHERHAQAKSYCPIREGVVMSIGDRGVRDAVEYENCQHDSWSKELPAQVPKLAGFVTSHLFHTVTEPG